MIQAEILRKGRKREAHVGLNDVAVTVGAFSRLVWFRTRVGGYHLGDLPADGIIVSTPTGSTAYCLAAGGPVIAPQVEALVVVPICPHTLSARPVVVLPDQRVEIEVPSLGPNEEVMATVDGQIGRALQSGDVVRVTQAARRARIVTLDGSFYEKLKTKLRWGVHA
jgi:NAD+ kinase